MIFWRRKVHIFAIFISSLSFGDKTPPLSSEIQILPTISAPLGLDEGVDTKLDASQVESLKVWANNKKKLLDELILSVDGLNPEDRLQILLKGISDISIAGTKKDSELFLRFILNRALKVYEILLKETVPNEVGIIDVKLRIIVNSIKLASKYFVNDLKYFENQKYEPNFVDFGVEYAQFLFDLNKSIFNVSAQYQIARTALGFLQWDLYRSLDKQTYSNEIIRIHTNLENISPEKTPTDNLKSLLLIRQMKKLFYSLMEEEDFKEILKKLGISQNLTQPQEPHPAPKDPTFNHNKKCSYNTVYGNSSLEERRSDCKLSLTQDAQQECKLYTGSKTLLNTKITVQEEFQNCASRCEEVILDFNCKKE